MISFLIFRLFEQWSNGYFKWSWRSKSCNEEPAGHQFRLLASILRTQGSKCFQLFKNFQYSRDDVCTLNFGLFTQSHTPGTHRQNRRSGQENKVQTKCNKAKPFPIANDFLNIIFFSSSFIFPLNTVFENHRKSRILTLRATSTFWVDKSSLKMTKMVNFDKFLKTWSVQSNSVTR